MPLIVQVADTGERPEQGGYYSQRAIPAALTAAVTRTRPMSSCGLYPTTNDIGRSVEPRLVVGCRYSMSELAFFQSDVNMLIARYLSRILVRMKERCYVLKLVTVYINESRVKFDSRLMSLAQTSFDMTPVLCPLPYRWMSGKENTCQLLVQLCGRGCKNSPDSILCVLCPTEDITRVSERGGHDSLSLPDFLTRRKDRTRRTRRLLATH